MIHIKRGFGDEKSQLRELNIRLDQYLSRVRQLENENQLLIEEIHRLRLERGAEWAQGYHSEICQLRRKVEDLSVQKCEAEIQKENLWQELQTLQALWEQVRAMRISIDQQLALYKQDLHQAKSSQAALEELYIRLQQECQLLQGSHQEDLLALREQVLKVPLHFTMQETVSPRLSIQDIQSISLEFSESWKEAFLVYQKKIEELENNLRLSEEERLGVEEEVRVHSLQMVELRREYEELLGIRKVLEDELLRMKEKYRLEEEEYLIIIEELEFERKNLTTTVTERLRDYHELMQVKTGLSLEVAAYRALLEGEKSTVIWTDRPLKERPAGSVASSFQRSTRYSGAARGAERNELMVTRGNENIKRQTQASEIHRFQSRTAPKIHIRPQYTDLGRTGSSYVSRVHEKSIQEKSDGVDTSFSPRYDLLKNRGIHQNVYEKVYHTIVEPYASKQSTTSPQKTKQGLVSDLKPVIIPKSHADVVHKAQRDTKVDDSVKETNLLNLVVEESKVTTKSAEEQKCDLELSVKNVPQEEPITKEDSVSVSKTQEKETSEEPKMQEIPVKKERKKREQAKKKREEYEKFGSSEINTIEGNKVEEHGSSHMEKVIVLGEKLEEEHVFPEIPIQFEQTKNSFNFQKISDESAGESQKNRSSKKTYVDEETTFARNVEGHVQYENVKESKDSTTRQSNVITSSENFGEREIVADILKHFGQPSALDDAGVTYVERKQVGNDGSVKTEIFVQSKTVEDVDFEEPDLASLWNRASQAKDQKTETTEGLADDQQKRKLIKTVIGAEAEDWIENIIPAGLKGRPELSVNVEIIEESIGTCASEKTEFSTPFHVEEAEDNYPAKEETSVEEEFNLAMKTEDNTRQPSEGPTHVEEVAESEDVDEETNYFVSIPDDIPIVEDEEEETIRGQIHIEEESHVKYSWQDEFLQGSQGQKTLTEFVKYASTNEPGITGHMGVDNSSIYRFETDSTNERDSKSETIVIEKEIKIPHKFQSSIMDLLSKENKDPKQQLKGALDCLQQSLPQDLVEELTSLAEAEQSQTSSLTVDIKKVDQTEKGGMVNIIAEINVSQTMDTDDAETLDLVEKVKSRDDALQSSTFENSEGRSLFVDSTKVESLTVKPATTNDSYSSITKSANNHIECYTSEEILNKEPSTKSIHIGAGGEMSQSQTFTDVSRFIKHTQVDSRDEYFSQGGSITDTETHDSAEELSPTETNRSFHHIKLGPRQMYSKEQIIFEGPISENLKLDLVNNTDSSEQNQSVRHIKISPTEKHPTEQIIFCGPIFQTDTVSSGTMGNFHLIEQYMDNSHKTAESSNLDLQVTGERVNRNHNLFQAEVASGSSKTVTHFKVNSGETHLTREIVFEGSIPNIRTQSINVGQDIDKPEDKSMPIEHGLGSQKIHTAKQIKFQGFISDPPTTRDAEGFAKAGDQSNINTSVHHIKLSPNKEQIIFDGPVSTSVDIHDKDNSSHSKASNTSIAHVHLGAKEIQTSERIIFEGPIAETYESSDFVVSSPSGDSTESERSIKHIRLGPTEKSFTFQMDITKVSTKYQDEDQESSTGITSRNIDRQPMISESYRESADDLEVDESGYGEEEMAGTSLYPYEVEIRSPGQHIINTSEFDKTVQMHRIVHQSSGISDEKKVAVVYLEEEEEPDQDYLRRSF
ncbi:synemin [Pelodytes ibericus]